MPVFKNIFSPKKTKYNDAKIREVFSSGTSLEQEKMADYLGKEYLFIYKRGGKHLSDKDKRLDAYMDAIEKLVRVLKGQTDTSINSEKPVEALFRKIFKDKCTDHLRAEKRTPFIESIDDSVFINIQALSKEAQVKLDEEYLSYIENDAFREALIQLRKIKKKCFEIFMFKADRYTYNEIAHFLGGNANENNVKANAHNCKKTLLALMENLQS